MSEIVVGSKVRLVHMVGGLEVGTELVVTLIKGSLPFPFYCRCLVSGKTDGPVYTFKESELKLVTEESVTSGQFDVQAHVNDELMVAHVLGVTNVGIEFVDSYMPKDGRLVVADAGSIVVHQDEVDRLVEVANEGRVRVEVHA